MQNYSDFQLKNLLFGRQNLISTFKPLNLDSFLNTLIFINIQSSTEILYKIKLSKNI